MKSDSFIQRRSLDCWRCSCIPYRGSDLYSSGVAFFFSRQSGPGHHISCFCMLPSEQQADRTCADEVFSHLCCETVDTVTLLMSVALLWFIFIHSIEMYRKGFLLTRAHVNASRSNLENRSDAFGSKASWTIAPPPRFSDPFSFPVFSICANLWRTWPQRVVAIEILVTRFAAQIGASWQSHLQG